MREDEYSQNQAPYPPVVVRFTNQLNTVNDVERKLINDNRANVLCDIVSNSHQNITHIHSRKR
jgi:hypothetical protein